MVQLPSYVSFMGRKFRFGLIKIYTQESRVKTCTFADKKSGASPFPSEDQVELFCNPFLAIPQLTMSCIVKRRRPVLLTINPHSQPFISLITILSFVEL